MPAKVSRRKEFAIERLAAGEAELVLALVIVEGDAAAFEQPFGIVDQRQTIGALLPQCVGRQHHFAGIGEVFRGSLVRAYSGQRRAVRDGCRVRRASGSLRATRARGAQDRCANRPRKAGGASRTKRVRAGRAAWGAGVRRSSRTKPLLPAARAAQVSRIRWATAAADRHIGFGVGTAAQAVREELVEFVKAHVVARDADITKPVIAPELDPDHRLYAVLRSESDKVEHTRGVVDVGQRQLPHPQRCASASSSSTERAVEEAEVGVGVEVHVRRDEGRGVGRGGARWGED